MWRRNSRVCSRLVSVGRDRFPRSWESLEQARRLGGAQESVREAPGAPGTPQEQLRNEQREFQKTCCIQNPAIQKSSFRGPISEPRARRPEPRAQSSKRPSNFHDMKRFWVPRKPPDPSKDRKKTDFLKLALLISELLLELPWDSWGVPEAFLGSPEARLPAWALPIGRAA